MKNVCIIAPMKSTANFNLLVDGVKTVCKNKFKFTIIALCDENINPSFKVPKELKFIKVEKGSSFNDKVQIGFEYTENFDATVVFDYYNENWREYLQALLQKFDEGADIIYLKKYKKPENFWQKLVSKAKKVANYVYQFFVKLFCKNEDLKVYNTFQLYCKDVADIIRTMPKKNAFLRNFDCWSGFNIQIINSDFKENKDEKFKFWNENTIFLFSLLIAYVAFLIATIICYPLVSFKFRFTYIAISIALSLFFVYFEIYFLIKNALYKRFGYKKSLK